jgi:acyl-CoA synthetase (AMP-forming)/AMP-acid ligase II
MDLLLSLNKARSLWAGREAVIDGKDRFSYEQLGRRVARLAGALEAAGLGRGQVVGIVAPNCHQFLEAYYGCAWLGAVINPVNFRLSVGEIAFILGDSGAKLVFAHTDFAEEVAKALADCPKVQTVVWLGGGETAKTKAQSVNFEEFLEGAAGTEPPQANLQGDDLAHLYYTSGTTGKPKGVMLTHGNVSVHALTAVGEMQLSDRDTWAHVAPMFHLADAWASFAFTWVGGRHVFLPYFEAGEVLATIQKEKVTCSNLIPTMLNMMVNHPQVQDFDYSSLRFIASGGAPMAPETVRRLVEAFGCDYIQTYGMTETSPYLTFSLPKAHMNDLPEDELLKVKSRTGRPSIGVELKVVREDGTPVDPDDQEVGEIIVRGPIVTPGYWNRPDATAEAIRDGWLYTGDLAVIDAEGYVNIVDRKKDMIVTGGENVYSTEVEYVLYEHPAVAECAVIGVPNEKWGEAVQAFVVLKPDAQAAEQELIDFVKERLARYKAPKSVKFIDAIPKTGSGKIYKKGLKEV